MNEFAFPDFHREEILTLRFEMMKSSKRRSLLTLFCIGLATLAASCSSSPEAQKKKALDQGDRFYREGKYPESALQYLKALQAVPKSGDAYLGLGRSEERQNNLWPAFEALSQAATLMPDSEEVKLLLSDVALRLYLGDPRLPQGLHQKITDLSDELLARRKDSFAAFRLKGYLAMSDGNVSNAIANFEKADSLHPNQADVVAMLVQNLMQNKQIEAGETRALSFLQSNGSYGPIYDILYSHYMSSGQVSKGENLLQEKVARNPKEGLFFTQLAEHYWRTNRHQEAASWITKLVSQAGGIPDAYIQAGDFYVRVQSWDDALAEYQAGMQANPKESLDYQEHMAYVLLSQGKRDEAGNLLDRIVKDHPDDHGALAARSALFASSGREEDLDRAIAGFKALLGKDPANFSYKLTIAAAYRARGDLPSATTQYLAVVQKNANYVPALQALAEIMIREERFADAQRYAERVISLDPGNPSARLVRTACLAAARNYTDAEVSLVKLTRDFPQLKEARLQMGLLRLAQGRNKDAEDIFLKFYRPGEADARLLKGLVEVYRAANKLDYALVLIQQEQKKSPKSPEIRRLFASVAADAGKPDLAIQQYEILVRDSPQSVEISVELALLYQKKGDYAKASASLDQARHLAPKDALPPALLGKIYEDTGQKQEAIAAYRASLALQPDNASVLNNLAYLLAETDAGLAEALTLGQKALQRQPDNPWFADTVGWIYFRKGNAASALQIFESLTKKVSANPTFRLHLAMALLSRGDPEGAEKELRTALRAHPSREEEVHIQQILARIDTVTPKR